MASTVTLQLTCVRLCWSNNIVAQRFSTAVTRELVYVPQRNIPNWIWWLVTHYPMLQLSGWHRAVVLKKQVWERT